MARGCRYNNDPNSRIEPIAGVCMGHDVVWQHSAKYGNSGARYVNGGAKYANGGATLLEFAVSATVLGVVAIIFLGRLLTAEEHAEKSAMELSISQMRAGLRAQVGVLLIADRAADIAALADGNPIDWLDVPPENYVGEFHGQPPQDIQGNWYFDSTRRELVYTANSRRHFVPSPTDGYTVRVKLVPVAAASGNPVAAHGEPGWVKLAVVNDYRWF